MVERAGTVTGARFAALGVYDGTGEIIRFVHRGLDAGTIAAIGSPPHGRGLLGESIARNRPTRVANIRADPRSVGFPDGHPEMGSFLGVPVCSGGRRYGSLYVTDRKDGRPFDEDDEMLLSALATFAACAIDNIHLVEDRHLLVEADIRLESVKAQEVLRQQKLQQVLDAQESERARLARDLHDEIGQSLTSVLLALRVLEQTPAGTTERQHRHHDVRELVAEVLDEVRALAFELRPAILDDFGLNMALRRLVDSMRSRLGVRADLHVSGLEDNDRLDPDLETVVYRVVQESLTNVARHAHTDTAQVSLRCSDGYVHLEVRDGGRGFDPDACSESLGLTGMRERAGLVGGRLTIDSAPDSGTTVTLEATSG